MLSTGLSIFFSFFVIHFTTLLCTSGGGRSIDISIAPSTPQRRVCEAFTRCSRTSNNSNPSILGYGEEATSLTSDGGRFRLGFFHRGNNIYVGIWYTDTSSGNGQQVNISVLPQTSEQVIVWVANRNNPMHFQHEETYFLSITDDGNAEVKLQSNNLSYWSTSYTTKSSTASNIILQLLDSGNLILKDRGGRGGTLWQSFDHPTDTFLLGMSVVNLTSWKSREDPAQGYYLFSQGEGLFMYNTSQRSSTPYWDSTFSSLHPYLTPLLNMTGNSSLMLRLVMNSTGSVQLWELNSEGTEAWLLLWEAPKDRCDLFDVCGSFGVCDAGNSFRCMCLPGYEPNDPVKWGLGDFSSGCSKRSNDQCGEAFLSLPMIKLPPDGINLGSSNETECRVQCRNTCGHTAYSYDPNQSRCLIWTNELTHIQEEYYSTLAQTLYIRVNHSDIDSGSRTCSICGTNVIPYPLSTKRDCGDPAYFQFQCNTTNGQVYFQPQNGKAYKVSLINPNSRTFFVQLPTLSSSDTCSIANIKSKMFDLNSSSPFSVITCSVVPLTDKQVVDVELSWKPPRPAACSSSADCKDWAQTACVVDRDGKRSCLCAKDFDWDPVYMNCTKVHHKNLPTLLKAGIATASGATLLLFGSFLFVLHLRRKREIHRAGIVNQLKTDDIEDIDIPFVDYQSILAATENFSDANKLGAGGFGPVYKGKLTDGNEVAVKRLSAASAQGIEEFRNEVILIAKLQHRNLVRVLGYCMKEEEKILIYEYMPNKSLSSYIFDQTMSPSLDWMKRLNIILGIARGLLYLHQDSRLRIIHRDLKPSNILLDEDLNPKISDFGLARIVAGNEMATTTARVVGTYGYMPPEYALDGYFSIKSDVYSFGIVMLEVISGRSCTSLFPFENSLVSLLGYAWTLWDKERALELVHRSIADSCDSVEVKRCINVALLCVQEDPSDRPTMSTVLLMLGGGDNMCLPYPNQPVFVSRKPPLETASSSSMFGSSNSDVELTTSLQGR